MQKTITLKKSGARKRRTYLPKLPISETRATLIYRILFIITPLLAFALVEMLNYNNAVTSFTPLQVCLNLIWYYLLELALYFIRGRVGSAVKWGLGVSWGIGMTNHYLILFRGRTLFPSDFLTLRTAANVAGEYSYRPDGMQLAATVIMIAYVVAVCLLPPQWERKKWSWKLFTPSLGVAAVFFLLFFQTGLLEKMNLEPSMWTTRGNGLALNFSLCLRYSHMSAPDGYSVEAMAALPDGLSAGVAAEEEEQPVNVIVIMGEAFPTCPCCRGWRPIRTPCPSYAD